MDSAETVKRRLLANRDDSVEGTFVYSLWEDAYFDAALCESVVRDFEVLADRRALDPRLVHLAEWVVDGVDLVFRSHHDPSDRATVKNYAAALEQHWVSIWEPRLREVLALGRRGVQ